MKGKIICISTLIYCFYTSQGGITQNSSLLLSYMTKPDTFLFPKSKNSSDTIFTIYMTFDDGPVNESKDLLSIAKNDSVPVIFFVVGEKVFANDTTLSLFDSYLHSPFIEVGNHSFSHARKKYKQYYKSPGKVIEDFKLNQDTLKLGKKIARLPGRNTWRINNRNRTDIPDAKASADSLAAIGYFVFGWDLEWRYASGSCLEVQSAELMLKEIEFIFNNKKTFSSNHIVLLAHDPMFSILYNQQQLEIFINKVKKNNRYRFGRIENYPK